MSINTKNIYDIIIIGGGASGLFFCANETSGAKKLILEGNGRLGTKILLAGGGRGNFTNLNANPTKYIGENTKMLPSFFYKFGANEMISRLEKEGITSKEEDHGRIFPQSNNSKTLLDCFINKAKKNNTTLLTNQKVLDITPPLILSKTKDPLTEIDSSPSPQNAEKYFFTIQTETNIFQTKKVIIATGGKTYPKTGTTGFAYTLANQFGIQTTEQYYQTLCGLETKENFSDLSGWTTPAKTTLYHKNKPIYEQERNLLFTHRGLSGPGIFNISLFLGNYCMKKKLPLDSFEDFSLEIQCKEISKRLKKFIEFRPHPNLSPRRRGATQGSISLLGTKGTDKEREVESEVINITATPKSFRSRNEAKVTGGGILMKELKQNFESKNIPGLYFLGECLDITGQTGGYNLQRCRTSAWICAKNIEK